jgi:hypothetical protein
LIVTDEFSVCGTPNTIRSKAEPNATGSNSVRIILIKPRIKANAAAIPDAGATNIAKVSTTIWDFNENDCSPA